MSQTKWRPPQNVRAIAIAVVRRGDELLLMNVKDDEGTTKGWRPIGGAIEFGETASATVTREVREELDVGVVETRFLGALENLYEHEGARGHELVMVHEVTLEKSAYARAAFRFTDGGVEVETEWVPLDDFRRSASTLFPNGLLSLLA